MECFSQSLVCNAGETIPREIGGLRILERLVRTVLTGHLGLPGVPNAAKHENFRTQLWEHREPRFLRLLVKAGKIQEKDEANSIELYERVIEMGERVADA